MRVPRILGAIAIAVAAMAVFGPRPVAAATVVAPDVKFMEFNYCGAPLNPNPDCPANGQYNGTLAAEIRAFHPAVVLISEICETQLLALKADLASGSNPWTFQNYYLDEIDWRDEPLGQGGCAGSNKRYGNAILTQKSWTRLPQDHQLVAGHAQSIARGETTVGGTGAFAVPLVVCNTHFHKDNPITGQQEEEATRWAIEWAQYKALLYGGDFNMSPGELSDLYLHNDGRFQEMDHPDNHATHENGNKIDYMFFKQAYAKLPEFRASKDVTASDHHVYSGYIDICSEPTCT